MFPVKLQLLSEAVRAEWWRASGLDRNTTVSQSEDPDVGWRPVLCFYRMFRHSAAPLQLWTGLKSCCSSYWMCCITDWQLMKGVSANTRLSPLFFLLLSTAGSGDLSKGERYQDGVFWERMSCVLMIHRGWSSTSLCGQTLTGPWWWRSCSLHSSAEPPPNTWNVVSTGRLSSRNDSEKPRSWFSFYGEILTGDERFKSWTTKHIQTKTKQQSLQSRSFMTFPQLKTFKEVTIKPPRTRLWHVADSVAQRLLPQDGWSFLPHWQLCLRVISTSFHTQSLQMLFKVECFSLKLHGDLVDIQLYQQSSETASSGPRVSSMIGHQLQD